MLKKELGEKYKYKSLVGKSHAMKKVFQAIDLAAKSDVNVLIEGESGTGKELVARAVHFNGLHKEGPFVAVNCGAIPENLLESELFGHEKGSFTGAVSKKIGKFEQAQGGTIFLDEIGDLSQTLQVKLLRILQEREIERVGGEQAIPIDVRFIVATNRDLSKLVGENKFREDLYFRVNVFPIRIPPLRERKEDIAELFRYFLKAHTVSGKRDIKVDEKVVEKLTEHAWPGNIRELENFVERLMMVKGRGDITERDLESLDVIDLETPNKETSKNTSLWSEKNNLISDAEKNLLENALKESGGNVSKASKILQVSRDTFYRKMRRYAIQKKALV